MHRIVASISTLAEHLVAVQTNPDAYRPDACPRCGVAGLWGHGCYYRKGERSTGGATREPVPVPRYLCPGCIRTCSRLPSFMSPRRWYCWAVQQVVLVLLLSAASLNGCCGCTGRALRTVVRWRDWLKERGESFAFLLRSRFPELGRICADHGAFWRHVIDNPIAADKAASTADQHRFQMTHPIAPDRLPAPKRAAETTPIGNVKPALTGNCMPSSSPSTATAAGLRWRFCAALDGLITVLVLASKSPERAIRVAEPHRQSSGGMPLD